MNAKAHGHDQQPTWLVGRRSRVATQIGPVVVALQMCLLPTEPAREAVYHVAATLAFRLTVDGALLLLICCSQALAADIGVDSNQGCTKDVGEA